LRILGALPELHFLELRHCSLGYKELRLLPSAQDLGFVVHSMREFKDGNDDGRFGLEYFASLQYVHVTILCNGASAAEVEEVEAAVRGAVDVHPNRPTLEVVRIGRLGRPE
jgi:disease resistance protein RPM1